VSTQTEPHSDPAGPAARPRNVDLALGAILLRCVLALAAAFALFGAEDELRRNAAELHPDWSASTLADKVESELRSNVVLTLVYIALVLLIAKFIRDGRNWARWLYAFFAVLVAGDVLRVAGFFAGDNLLFRLLSGLTGLAAAAAIVLLFSPSASRYFRPAAGAASPMRMLFGGRAGLATSRGAAAQAPKDASERVSLAKPAGGSRSVPGNATAAGKRPAAGSATAVGKRSAAGSATAVGKRPAPRAKSRKQASE
jgi:hypothetical protein